jgi:hypothetical protein
LTKTFIKLGGKIYTETKAENITKNGATANDFNIQANHIVFFTNTFINDWVTLHTKQWTCCIYLVAAKIEKRKWPYALWWNNGDQRSKWISNGIIILGRYNM